MGAAGLVPRRATCRRRSVGRQLRQRIGVIDTVRQRVLHDRRLAFNSAAVTAAGRVVAFQDAWQDRPAVITFSADLKRLDVTRAPRIRAAVGTDAQLTWIAAASNRGSWSAPTHSSDP